MASPEKARKLRCAIYTRKSTDEGLDQEFNSLDAQREACAAYILSQKHEGWTALPTFYDDGGFSGGSMERPALKALLADVEARKIDVVVVYKVDRLTRALADFARIVAIFDAANVSFVSVTQAFNTTSSMGRLTLNVLLSFAQFEREVTAERIRDKIAASKKKGMWMGGAVPIGYRVEARKLVPHPEEAAQVRAIFEALPRARHGAEAAGGAGAERPTLAAADQQQRQALRRRGLLARQSLRAADQPAGHRAHPAPRCRSIPDNIRRSSSGSLGSGPGAAGAEPRHPVEPADGPCRPVPWLGGCSIPTAIRCVPATPTTANAATATMSAATSSRRRSAPEPGAGASRPRRSRPWSPAPSSRGSRIRPSSARPSGRRIATRMQVRGPSPRCKASPPSCARPSQPPVRATLRRITRRIDLGEDRLRARIELSAAETRRRCPRRHRAPHD